MANNTEPRVTALEAAMVELAQAQTRTEQRLDEFIHQAGRLLGDHGSRLSRIEAQIESLVALFQASDRRLNRVEAQIEALTESARASDRRLSRLESLAEAHDQRMTRLEGITVTNAEAIRDLQVMAQTNEQRYAQLAASQSQVLSRMDDVIAVLRERL